MTLYTMTFPNLTSIASLLLVFIGVLPVDAAALTHQFIEGSDLLSGCRFNLGDRVYDLCPLVHEKGMREVLGTTRLLDTINGRSYLSRRLYRFTLDHDLCSEGTWICMSETRGSDNPQHQNLEWDTHIPIAGKQRHESSLGDRNVDRVTAVFDSPPLNPRLSIFLNGGHDGDPQFALIELICEPDSDSTNPLFSAEKHGVHSFTWSTKHACLITDLNPSPQSAHHIRAQRSDPADHDSPPQHDDSEEELIDPIVPPKVSRRWVAFVLLVAGSLLITFSVILAFPRTCSVLNSHLKTLSVKFGLLSIPNRLRVVLPRSFNFRPNDNRLVRWAQEDMSLDMLDLESHGQMDVMVNGDSALAIGEDWDEYIPLKSGKPITNRGYGSALREQF